MTLQRLIDADSRHVAIAATLVLFVLLVLMAVFLYIVRLARDDTAVEGLPSVFVADDIRPAGTASAANGMSKVAGRRGTAMAVPSAPLPLRPVSGAQLTSYDDRTHGFHVAILDSWRKVDLDSTGTDPKGTDYDVVFEDPSSAARLAVSVWATSPSSEWDVWAGEWLPGMLPFGGAWAPTALVAGEPAVVAWAPETPTAPAQYAVVLDHDGARYRLAYGAADGGTLMEEFVRAVVTFDFDRTAAAVDVPPDQLPPLPPPSRRYFPVEAPAAP